MNERQASPWLKAGIPGIALVLCSCLPPNSGKASSGL